MTDDDHGNHQRYSSFWAKALEDFHGRLTSRALRLSNGRAYDAEDLMQETACRALVYARDPGEIRNPLAYLLRMMRNVWVDKWSQENKANAESLEDLVSNGREPAVEPVVQRILESAELKAEMDTHRGPLTPREKLLLELHLKGYKTRDIAERLGEDVRLTRSDLNAVKAKVRYRLARAKAKASASGRA